MHLGTVTHMAPELIEHGEVSTKCDVYAFGIFMFECYTRLTPYKGLGSPQILMGVVSSKLRPAFASTTPQGYVVRNPTQCRVNKLMGFIGTIECIAVDGIERDVTLHVLAPGPQSISWN
jgi:serine/threonine protein kinase